jgi:hypothetical protein
MKRIFLVVMIGLALAVLAVSIHRHITRRNAWSPSSGGSATSENGSPVGGGRLAPTAVSESSKAAEVPWDQEIHFDDDGLIVHGKNAQGQWDGGDTAQREGFYWLGVWIRENILHKPWPYKRSLTFDQVLDLLEQKTNGQPDGVFYRHPKIPPYNNPWDKEWGFSRDQMVPLVAAMGVYGKYDALHRLWDALPQDQTGKHTFNGSWEFGPIPIPGVKGIPGVNCDDIRKQSCDLGPCPGQLEQQACQASIPDPPPCMRPPDPPGCPSLFGVTEPSCKLARDHLIDEINLAFDACQRSRNAAMQPLPAARSACLAASKGPCEERKFAGRIACETHKRPLWVACATTNHFTGDPVVFSALNLFRRALNENPMIFKVYDPPLPAAQGTEGEVELAGGVADRIRQAQDGNNVGDDLNLIVLLLMSKLRCETPISAAAVRLYARSRPHSYGSYMIQYYAKFGKDTEDILNRIKNSGWRPDPGVSPPLGALRWYNRPSERANPRLAELYAPILEALIKK